MATSLRVLQLHIEAVAAVGPGLTTLPVPAARIGVPVGAAKSTPACMALKPRIGCSRMPKREVMLRGIHRRAQEGAHDALALRGCRCPAPPAGGSAITVTVRLASLSSPASSRPGW